jgi:DNA-binding CsgD family transcriptional regulator
MTAAETGLRLGITGHTVKWFRASAIRKLAAANITEAVAIATARGLLEVAV